MYREHVPLIREHCLASPDGLHNCLTFVLSTIQQGLSSVPMIMDDIDKYGNDSAFLFGSKRTGYQYITDNSDSLYNQACELFDPVQAVSLFYQIPGIGAVKAGFCAQLLGINTGCIDSHNLKLLGIPANQVNVVKSLKPATIRKKLHDYVDLTLECGGAETLWNSWCEHVAGNQANKSLLTGEAVSELHLTCIARSI